MTQLIGLPRSRFTKWSAFALSTLLVAALGAACSSSSNTGDDDDDNDNDSVSTRGGTGNTVASTGGTSSTGTGGTKATGGTGTSYSTVKACPGVAYDPSTDSSGTACTGTGSEGEPSPLDLMMLMDRTQSMTYALGNSDRWTALRTAVEQFVTDPNSQAIRVGVQFFSLTGNADLVKDCDANAYVQPAVEIGALSQTAQPILNAMDALVLGGQTPSAPALQGVIWHAQDWQKTNLPGRKTAVLVVTDGLPTQCPTAGNTEASVDDIVAVTQAGLAGVDGPPITTYVIGVSMGANSFNLHRVAAGGGTREAFLVTDSPDATDQLVTALRNITSDKLACEYQLPKPDNQLEALDTAKVRVLHTDGAGRTQEIPYAGTRGGCSSANGGWYYDDEAKPSKIIMCPCTCANFSAGSVTIQIGCKPAPVTLG